MLINRLFVQVQLRFSPALANKPKAPQQRQDGPASRTNDPFDNPSPQLLVTQLPPSHLVVLNKFAIVPEHFILATKAFKQQTHLLEADDLDATYGCIQAYASHRDEGELFAFFNSGEHSGASQPHRHIQMLPVARMRDGIDERDRHKWSVLAEDLGDVPFTTFSAKLHAQMSPAELHAIYLDLYRKACGAFVNFSGSVGADVTDRQQDGESKISYNLGMTRNSLTILPRLAEGSPINTPDGNVVGNLALNGTVLAGTALVKNEAEWDALRRDPNIVFGVLKKIGIPSNSQVNGKM
jgi:sulfate adenylyltransferase (ADP) / ATP adenylyltransferase